MAAHIGSPIGPGVMRFWDPFCAPEIGKVGFARGFGGEIFLEFGFGGLREKGPGCALGFDQSIREDRVAEATQPTARRGALRG